MQQVVRQIKERRRVQLQRQDIKYELWRLDDTEFRKLRQKSLPIKDDSRFYVNYPPLSGVPLQWGLLKPKVYPTKC
ncbi:hypothetical protein [Nostoc sp. FACHB-280]|uniref:hypothetical protein n=1 Tax=Nostoc sp. FACHB-280 TaxID=2692839 RepID=UPI00168ABB89|nr:hypothetical protein [Nostoc sp. FACHB-280]MBD2498878.1 hypothetical protein [Nostoc sp. FACHB-280]